MFQQPYIRLWSLHGIVIQVFFLGGETYKASRLLTELLSDVAKLRPGALANRLPMKRKCAQPFLDTWDGINLNFSLKLQYILTKGDN